MRPKYGETQSNCLQGSYSDVVDELKRIYKTKMLPLEKLYHFDHFYSPPTSDAEFDCLPHVLLLGQYSVGKTSVRICCTQ